MIIDVRRFLAEEQPYWRQLEGLVDALEGQPRWKVLPEPYLVDGRRLPGLADVRTGDDPGIEQARQLHYLYERASADLVRLNTFCAEPQVRRYLETLVARAYSLIHSTARPSKRIRPIRWFFQTFPQTFRRHVNAFWLSLAVSLFGALFGGVMVMIEPEAKRTVIPFGHLQGTPQDRVAEEEADPQESSKSAQAVFAAQLMTHNTEVAIKALAFGAAWGVGSILLLFYNGVILGAVCVDYVQGGAGKFLAGWLLPHGSIELPAIFLAGQAGLVLGRAIIGWGDRYRLSARLRKIGPDLATLIIGVAVLLVWAGIVEAFFSQYHEPVIPYTVKIIFGLLELAGLVLLLGLSGRHTPAPEAAHA